jgi:hypothetical protein
MNLALVSLITLAAVDYSVISNAFGDINSNFNLIQKSFGRVSEFQRIAFDLRALIMLNEGLLFPNSSYIANGTSFATFLKQDVKEALAQLYEYQSSLSLSPLSISAG